MYIDHDIIIEETLPAMLQENIADLERYYAEDNWAEYLLLQELFEATVKQFCINGKITGGSVHPSVSSHYPFSS